MEQAVRSCIASNSILQGDAIDDDPICYRLDSMRRVLLFMLM